MAAYTTYNQRKIAYQQTGEGDVVVLLHGFCEDSTMWADFVNYLKEKYSVLTIDLSGFGQSDLLEEQSIEIMAEAVNLVLIDLGVKRCVMIGHSMGGYVSLAFAEQYGEKLSGLGLFHSHPYADSEEKRKNRHKSIKFIQKHGVAPFVAHLFPNLFGERFLKENPTFMEDFIAQCSQNHCDAVVAASYAMLKRKDRSKVLADLTCPVLFIVGKQDQAISLHDSLEQTHLPDTASIYLFEEVGHMGMFEAKQATMGMLSEFLIFCNLMC